MNEETLRLKIRRLSDSVWGGRASGPAVEEWLDAFASHGEDPAFDRLCMLNLLSNFLYFGIEEVRELLSALYTELYRRPLLTDIRRSAPDALDVDAVDAEFERRLGRTRFLGVGNPSESGPHLLYYLRQETKLGAGLFINHFELPGFADRMVDVDRYVFIDDLCGSGDQALEYSDAIVGKVRAAAGAAVRIDYYALLATTSALGRLRKESEFDEVACVMELGEDFRCFGKGARFWTGPDADALRTRAREICLSYGRVINARHPLGHADVELAIGFNHNTPDDTLPVFWSDGGGIAALRPIFRRYGKAA